MDTAALRDWVKGHPAQSILAGVGVVLVVLVVAGLLSSEPDTEPPPVAATDVGPTEDPDWADRHPAYAPLDCNALTTFEDIDTVFGVEGENRDVITFGQGERCRRSLADDDDYWVEVEPGDPADFDEAAQFAGATGTRVTGVGDDAVWFGGPETSVLTTFKDTEFGGIYFRIRLSRPDTGPDAELELVKGLAATILPRFPGGAGGPAGEPITFDQEPPDPAQLGYRENLLAKVDDGEWTLGEGLVATLQLMAEEVSPEQVLRHPDVVSDSVVGVLNLAEEYLENEDDDEASAEIARLMNLLSPDLDVLVASTTDSGEAQAAGPVVRPVGFTSQDEDPGDWCSLIGVLRPCNAIERMPEVEAQWGDKYTLLRLTSHSNPDVDEPWPDTEVETVKAAILKSATLFEPMGTMPKTVVHLGFFQQTSIHWGGACKVHVGLQAPDDPAELSQHIAEHLARCLVIITHGFTWSDGLAAYLGGVVFPNVDLEHDHASTLRDTELATSLLDRKHANWSLFEYLHPILGAQGSFDSVPGLPESASDYFHQYVLALSDAQLVDVSTYTSGIEKLVPFTPESSNARISGANTYDLTPPPFGQRRVDFQVDSGMVACATLKSSGAVEVSRRPGAAGSSSDDWEQLTFPGDTGELKMNLEGDFVVVVTVTGQGVLDIQVDDVVEEGEECEEESTRPGAPAPYDRRCGDCLPSFFYWLQKHHGVVIG